MHTRSNSRLARRTIDHSFRTSVTLCGLLMRWTSASLLDVFDKLVIDIYDVRVCAMERDRCFVRFVCMAYFRRKFHERSSKLWPAAIFRLRFN